MAEKGWSDKAKTGESGLHDDFIISIGKSGTGIPEGYDGPVWLVEGELELPDGRLIDGDLRLGIGDFEPGDKEGTWLLHSSQNPDKHLSSQSGAMKFISSAIQAGVPLEERSRVMDGRDLEERDLKAWEGLRVRVTHVQEMRRNPKTGVEKMGRQPLVTEYLGTVDAPKAPSGGNATESPAPAAPSSNGSTEDKARLLARASGNYLEYLEKVTGQLGVDPSDDVAAEAFYTSAKS